ncbi:uncharacterized protein QC763_201393 [Podospora pseudopauciseta]|uniref:small monomeric GTPase n=1 Tax=Podospora pseudopauciseta TaxID=2093780 RepID=A0ABR0HN87_9PEZI|nr:hypothetical protein QC763_201393 [Podospora pseudopauciseta]
MVASFVWTAEEAKYLKAVLRWQDAPSSDDDATATRPRQPRRRPPPPPQATIQLPSQNRRQPQEKEDHPPSGELRVLVLGAKGAGKSSLLSRFSQGTFPPATQPTASTTTSPSGESHSGSCRHPIFLLPSTTGDSKKKKYIIDALEFPSNQSSSNPLLEQALAITEAAVVVYDTASADSFRLAKGVVEFILEHFDPLTPSPNNSANRRVYPVVLVGNKFDNDKEREVSEDEGREAAGKMGVRCMMGVSARTGEGVQGVFETIGAEVLAAKRATTTAREVGREMVQGGGYEKAGNRPQLVRQGGSAGGSKKKGGLLRRMFWGRKLHTRQGVA